MRWLIIVTALVCFLLPVEIYAHPGRTASDGCHYCRTNCSSWGVAWNARHCHGGYIAPTVTTSPRTPDPTLKVSTPTPTPRPTLKPTTKPKTSSPDVSVDSDTSSSTTEGVLVAVAVLGGYGYLLYKGRK